MWMEVKGLVSTIQSNPLQWVVDDFGSVWMKYSVKVL